jgi:hypothetical protein
MLGMRSCGAAALLAFMLAAGPAAADTRIGGIVERDYTGAVGIRAGQDSTERLFYDHAVFSEERVKTGRDARTRLRFLDATELTVGGNSNVLLDRFIYDPQSGAGEAAITFSKGVFRFVTGSIRTKEAITLKTPTATIAIRGTHLIVTVHGSGSAEVAVVEGEILVQPCGNTPPLEAVAPATVSIAQGCEAATRSDGYTVPSMFKNPNQRQEKQGQGDKESGDTQGKGGRGSKG